MSLHELTDDPSTGVLVMQVRIRAAHIPPPRPHNLRIATWNIRRFGEGVRLDTSIEMIAALLRQFDIVSIVELCDDTSDLERTLDALGPHFGVVFSDYLRDAAGNRERIGFVFDQRRIHFTGLASNADGARKLARGRYVAEVPWWRPPFLASFRRGTFSFLLVAAHVRWGEQAAARRAELAALAEWISGRSKERYFGERDVVVVGDFNVSLLHDGAALEALATRGLVIAPGIEAHVTTDLARNKRYDQIMCLPQVRARFTGRAGALDFYAGDHHALFPGRRITKTAFTFQLSDHLPLWAELAVG
jgi:endonuclease/exonuclease/phosphatase family metal-dependent hydrolase